MCTVCHVLFSFLYFKLILELTWIIIKDRNSQGKSFSKRTEFFQSFDQSFQSMWWQRFADYVLEKLWNHIRRLVRIFETNFQVWFRQSFDQGRRNNTWANQNHLILGLQTKLSHCLNKRLRKITSSIIENDCPVENRKG